MAADGDRPATWCWRPRGGGMIGQSIWMDGRIFSTQCDMVMPQGPISEPERCGLPIFLSASQREWVLSAPTRAAAAPILVVDSETGVLMGVSHGPPPAAVRRCRLSEFVTILATINDKTRHS